jgi:PAS domain S-box-containing protein
MVPSSFLDIFFLKVPHYQTVSRLGVLMLLLFSGILLIELCSRKQKMANALLESEKRYQYLIDHANVGTCIVQNRIIKIPNLKFLEITGYSEEEVGKLSFTDIVHPDDLDLTVGWYEMVMAGENPDTDTPFQILTKEQEIKWLQVSTTLIVWQDEPALFNVFHDVTNRQIREEKDQQAKKMEAIGLLAGGMAHDLNNILSGIVSYPDLLLQLLPKDSPLCSHVKIMHEAGLRAAAVVADLLTVARGEVSTRHVADLNMLAENFLKTPECQLLKERYPGIDISSRLQRDKVAILCSEIQIQKSIMNLMFNACEAIEQASGEVILSTSCRDLTEAEAQGLNIKAGSYAVLSVADTGSGISEEQKAHIFEPFYTRKTMGRSGTGLGLTVVWNTVVDHDGAIDIKTSEQGTTFCLYLPSAQLPEISRESLIDSDGFVVCRGSGERILIVDDDPRQREIGTQFLEFLKYTPESVASGEEAIKFLRHQRVDLVVLDMVMDPGINGRETYEQIIGVQPGQKVLLVSGYADDHAEIARAMNLGVGAFLKKPYSLKQLAGAVHTELNGV